MMLFSELLVFDLQPWGYYVFLDRRSWLIWRGRSLFLSVVGEVNLAVV